MEISVIGLGGVGRTIVSLLLKEDYIDRIKCLDIDETLVKETVDEFKSSKVIGEVVDASEIDSITDAIIDSDIVINATKPWFNDSIMRACIWTGSYYIDLSSINILEQLEKERLWKRNGLIGILSIGEDPGISNIIAKYLSKNFEEIKSIKIRDGGEIQSNLLSFLFAPDVAIEDLIFKAGKYVNNKLTRVLSLTEKEIYNFPIVGQKPVYLVDHEEPYTLPYYLEKKVKYVDFKMHLKEDEVKLVKQLKELGIFREYELKYGNQEIIPIYFLEWLRKRKIRYEAPSSNGYEIVVVDVEGYLNGDFERRRGYFYLDNRTSMNKYNTIALYYLTAVPAVIAVKMIGNGIISEPGLYVPEQLDYNYFLRELEKYGVDIKFEKM